VLLDAGRDIADQLALLERAHCLTARARAERSTVAALLEQTARAHDDAAQAGGLAPEDGGPWLCDAVRDVLRANGYLDELAWATLESGASPENPRVMWLIGQVRGTQAGGSGGSVAGPAAPPAPGAPATGSPVLRSPAPGAPAAGGAICSACRRNLPGGAAFCGYCGHKLAP
jgi:hypothetical protein